MDYSKLTVRELHPIAKSRNIKGYSRLKKAALIAMLKSSEAKNPASKNKPKMPSETNLQNPVIPEVEIKTALPTPDEFKVQILAQTKRTAVAKLARDLTKDLLSRYVVNTVSTKLSAYRKVLYGVTHEDDNLNETIPTASKGNVRQTIAIGFLVLPEDKHNELKEKREENREAKKGFAIDGTAREISIPKISQKTIIEKACSFLSSDKYPAIINGILALAGTRKFETCTREYKHENVLYTREWVLVGEYEIAIKGLAKKGACRDWFIRTTLAPASLILKARERALNLIEANRIKNGNKLPQTDKEFASGWICKAVSRYFKKAFPDTFASIDAYDDNGNIIKDNGSPHKLRSFYGYVLKETLTAYNFDERKKITYIQKSLAHTSTAITQQYLDRYDSNDFIDFVKIDIPDSIRFLGKVSDDKVQELNRLMNDKNNEQTDKEQTDDEQPAVEVEKDPDIICLNITEMYNAIGDKGRLKFLQLLESGLSPEASIFELIKTGLSDNPEPKKVTGNDKIRTVIEGVVAYNEMQPEIANQLYPSYSVVSVLHKKLFGTEAAKSTYDSVWVEVRSQIIQYFDNRGFPDTTPELAKAEGKTSQSRFNGKYHRKNLAQILDKVMEVLENTV